MKVDLKDTSTHGLTRVLIILMDSDICQNVRKIKLFV